jgi:hypothetical protein
MARLLVYLLAFVYHRLIFRIASHLFLLHRKRGWVRSKAKIEIPIVNRTNQMASRTRRLASLVIMPQTRRFSQRSERSESPLTELESEDQQQPQSPLRKRRRKTTKPEVVEPVVYDIPPVQSRTTTYRGLVSASTFFVLPAEHSGPLCLRASWLCAYPLPVSLPSPLVLN